MKKVSVIIIIIITMFLTVACTSNSSENSGIQGVNVRDSGEVSVTFKVPDGMTVENVLGSEIGDENTFYVSNVTGNANGFYVYWYRVNSGGIVSCRDNIYRYGPEATVSFTTGVSAPPNWVLLLTQPSDDEVFNPEDAEKLAEKYGINLNFKG